MYLGFWESFVLFNRKPEMMLCNCLKRQYHPMNTLLKVISSSNRALMSRSAHCSSWYVFIVCICWCMKSVRITINLPWQLEGSISLTMKNNLSTVKANTRIVISIFWPQRINNFSKVMLQTVPLVKTEIWTNLLDNSGKRGYTEISPESNLKDSSACLASPC